MTDIQSEISVEKPGIEIKAHKDMNQFSVYNNNKYIICSFSYNIY